MIKALSYVGFSSPDAAAWRTFAPDLLGLEVVSSAEDEVVRLRMDEAAWRIAIRRDEVNGLDYLGWDISC
jgi:hypothetical protein